MSISREDVAKYHRVIATFRATDLQKVIETSGQPTYGAKSILVQRVTALISQGHQPALKRIREIGRTVYNWTDSALPSATMPQRQTSAYQYAQPSRGVPSALPAYRPQQVANNMQSRHRATSIQMQHPAHLQPTVENVSRVTMTEMPYYKVEDPARHYIVRTTAMPSRGGTQQDASINVQLPADVAQLIMSSALDQPLPRTEVLLRFAPLNSAETQQDEYPDELAVKINQFSVDTMPPTNPPQRVGTIGKRSNRHTEITQLMHQIIRGGRYHSGQATSISVTLRWTQNQPAGELPKLFVFHIVVVKHVTAKYLIEESKLLNKTPANVTRSALIAHIAKSKEDEDIIGTDEVKITLKDPLTMTRMRVPIRGQECTHFQCFDLIFWLTINEKRPTCKCPVCGRKIRYSTMRPEAYFVDMLAVCPESVDRVTLHAQGNWVATNDKGAVVCQSNPDGGVEGLKTIEIVQPVVSLDDDTPSGPTGDRASPTKAPTAVTTNKRAADTSIITLSDDDDEPAPPPPKRVPAVVARPVSPSPPQDPVQRAPPPQLSTVPATPAAAKMTVTEHQVSYGKASMYTMPATPAQHLIKDELDDNAFLEYSVVKLFVTRTPANHRYKVLTAYAEALVAIDEMAVAAGIPVRQAREMAVAVWPARDDVYKDINYPHFPFTDKSPYYSNELQSYMAKVTNQNAVELFVSAAAQAASYPSLTIVLGVKSAPRTAYVYTTAKLNVEPDSRVLVRIKRRVDAFLHKKNAEANAQAQQNLTTNTFRSAHAQAQAATSRGVMQTQRPIAQAGPVAHHVNVNQGSAVYARQTATAQQQVQQAMAQQQQQQMMAAQAAYSMQQQQQAMMQQQRMQQQQQQAQARANTEDVVWR